MQLEYNMVAASGQWYETEKLFLKYTVTACYLNHGHISSKILNGIFLYLGNGTVQNIILDGFPPW